MDRFIKQLEDILFELKTYDITGLKAEFEAEGASVDEILFLKKISKKAGINLCVKISGPQAMRDLYDLKKIEPNRIIAPMVESSYAAYKFVESAEKVFYGDDVKFFIDIETKAGFKCLDEILASFWGEKISGIIIGRNDLVNCLNFENGLNLEPDSDIILNYALSGGETAKKYGKKVVAGGLITGGSVPFLRKLKTDLKEAFYGFETRKIVFGKEAINVLDIEKGILKALEFETLWLLNRINSGKGTNQDIKRLEEIKKRQIKEKI